MSSAGRRKNAGQRLTFYRWATRTNHTVWISVRSSYSDKTVFWCWTLQYVTKFLILATTLVRSLHSLPGSCVPCSVVERTSGSWWWTTCCRLRSVTTRSTTWRVVRTRDGPRGRSVPSPVQLWRIWTLLLIILTAWCWRRTHSLHWSRPLNETAGLVHFVHSIIIFIIISSSSISDLHHYQFFASLDTRNFQRWIFRASVTASGSESPSNLSTWLKKKEILRQSYDNCRNSAWFTTILW